MVTEGEHYLLFKTENTALAIDSLVAAANPLALTLNVHCRNGQNLISDSGKMVPETRENTLSSFCRAVSNGATFIEFDVQVTSDGVPVIWHDNYVVTGDPKAPTFRMISEITLAEFKGLCSSDGFPASQPLLRRFHRQDGTLMSDYTVWRVVEDSELLKSCLSVCQCPWALTLS